MKKSVDLFLSLALFCVFVCYTGTYDVVENSKESKKGIWLWKS